MTNLLRPFDVSRTLEISGLDHTGDGALRVRPPGGNGTANHPGARSSAARPQSLVGRAMVLAGMTFAEAGGALEWQLFHAEGRPIEGGTGARDDVFPCGTSRLRSCSPMAASRSSTEPAGAFRQRLRGLEL